MPMAMPAIRRRSGRAAWLRRRGGNKGNGGKWSRPGRFEGDGLDDAIGEDGGVERDELVVDEDGGEWPGEAAHLAYDVLGLDSSGIGHLFAGCISYGDLLHA